eukprot:m.7360 g.7360  ORF g.7360 m.7360 type:complete len:471 (-) comp3703_c0_seq1:99-1511(-)
MGFTFTVLCATAVVLVILKVVRRKKEAWRSIPEPDSVKKHWLLGHILHWDPNNYLGFAKKIAAGVKKIVRVSHVGHPVILALHPDEAQKYSSITLKHDYYKFFELWLSKGCSFTNNDERWKLTRKGTLRGLKKDKFPTYFDHIKSCVNIFNKKYTTSGPVHVDVSDAMSRLTCDIGLQIVASYESHCQIKETHVPGWYAAMSKNVFERISNPLRWNNFCYKFTNHYKEAMKQQTALKDYMENIVRLRLQESDPCAKQDCLKEFLPDMDGLLRGCSEEEKIESLTYAILELTFAAFDTGATSLAWTMYLFAKYPEFQEQLRDEANEVLREGYELQLADVKRLQFADMFVKESLRMYPPVPVYGRVHDGVQVDMAIYAQHYNPTLFPEPEKFNPQRFADGKSMKGFSAYAAGVRGCLGQQIAQIMLVVVCAQIVQKFKISLDPNYPEPEPITNVLIVNKHGPINLIFEPLTV